MFNHCFNIVQGFWCHSNPSSWITSVALQSQIFGGSSPWSFSNGCAIFSGVFIPQNMPPKDFSKKNNNKTKSMYIVCSFSLPFSPLNLEFSGPVLGQESVHHHRSQWVAWQNTKALVHRWSRGVTELIQLWRPRFCVPKLFWNTMHTQGSCGVFPKIGVL